MRLKAFFSIERRNRERNGNLGVAGTAEPERFFWGGLVGGCVGGGGCGGLG